MSAFRRWAQVVVPLVALVGCDHATKYLAKTQLESGPPRSVIGNVLRLRYAENTDMAFNLLRWIPESVRRPLLLGFGALAIAALVMLVVRGTDRGFARLALLLILAGALGNYLDRLGRGYVVDFIHVPYWPVFNVADIWVTTGGLLLFAVVLIRRREPRPIKAIDGSNAPPELVWMKADGNVAVVLQAVAAQSMESVEDDPTVAAAKQLERERQVGPVDLGPVARVPGRIRQHGRRSEIEPRLPPHGGPHRQVQLPGELLEQHRCRWRRQRPDLRRVPGAVEKHPAQVRWKFDPLHLLTR